MHLFFAPLLFLLVSGILFFVPGFLLLRAFFGKKGTLLPFETFLFSFGMSMALLDFLMIALGKAGILYSPLSLSLGLFTSITVISGITWSIQKFQKQKLSDAKTETASESVSEFPFSKHQSWLFVLLITLTILIKTIYMMHAVLPTATDLGHHLYWSKLISETGTLPIYAKQEIITGADGVYSVSAPQPIADFIIGEHLPFSAINIISHINFFSAFPVVFLLCINLLSLLALATLALRLASGIKTRFLSAKIFTPQNIALATLLFFGPLYTLASPQAKFVSGGVVGNTFGNLFIPLILLAYYRAFEEKRPGFLALGFSLTFTLAYIHHLSTLILLFVLIASALAFLILHFDDFTRTIRSWMTLFFSPGPLFVTLFAIIFFFAVAMPTYIETSAVGTALGTPTKTTRTGLSFLQISSSNGEARVALGLAGIILLLIATRLRNRYANAFLFGWGIILFIMTLRPDLLFIDIPSSRIGAYLSFPLGVLAAFSAVGIFALLRKAYAESAVSSLLFSAILFSLFVFSIGSGSFDNSQTLLPKNKALGALETFHAASYLASHAGPEDIVLKDHNYITADSWIKLFFMRDYSFPFSRGFFKRYEDNPSREQCTLLMISVPNTAQGEKCYDETGTNFVMVNPSLDTAQFEKSEKFSRIYANDGVHIYARNQ